MRAPRSRRASLDTLIDELLSLQSLLLSEARAAGEWGTPCSPAFHFHGELHSNVHAVRTRECCCSIPLTGMRYSRDPQLRAGVDGRRRRRSARQTRARAHNEPQAHPYPETGLPYRAATKIRPHIRSSSAAMSLASPPSSHHPACLCSRSPTRAHSKNCFPCLPPPPPQTFTRVHSLRAT